jgi:hypothetical protein
MCGAGFAHIRTPHKTTPKPFAINEYTIIHRTYTAQGQFILKGLQVKTAQGFAQQLCAVGCAGYRKTRITEGKGAPASAFPKISLPFTKRISSAFMANRCHHSVSVRAGSKNTASFRFSRFSQPFVNTGSIGGVTINPFPFPRNDQPIGAFQWARVEVKIELLIELCVERCGSCPIWR